MMSPEFESSLPLILKHEGGYVNDPDDSGGATNKGITQSVYNRYRLNEKLPVQPVRNIEDGEAEEIYYRNYWLDGKCHKLPVGVNLVHFDFAVNAGIGRAAKTLQKVVGVTDDGLIGPKTIDAVASYAKGIEELIKAYSRAREAFYVSISKGKNEKFLKGWLIRTKRTEETALALWRKYEVKV